MARYDTMKTAAAKFDLFVEVCRKELCVVPVKEHRFHPTRMWRFDYAFPEYKVALEVEGGVYTQGRHTRPRGFLGDVDKYNAAAVSGWCVLRTTPSELCRMKTIELLKKAINGKSNTAADVEK